MKKTRIIIIGIAAILFVGVIGLLAYMNSTPVKLGKHLELGNNYLAEQDYEQAKVEFEQAIEIDPMNAEAYLGLAEAYVGLGDYEGALDVLQKGYEETSDEVIFTQMDEYRSEWETLLWQQEQERKVAEAETTRKLEQEISEYIAEIPVVRGERTNPVFTYSYLQEIYDERLPQLYQYLEMDISEGTKEHICFVICSYYLSVNDMEKAREWHAKREEHKEKSEYYYNTNEVVDEYGRSIYRQEESGYIEEYEYYENTGLLKSIKAQAPASEGDHVNIFYEEYQEYDEEGRVLSSMWYGHYGNNDKFPEMPYYTNVIEVTHIYSDNVVYDWSKGSNTGVRNNKPDTPHKWENGTLISYDDKGNIISSGEWDGNASGITK